MKLSWEPRLIILLFVLFFFQTSHFSFDTIRLIWRLVLLNVEMVWLHYTSILVSKRHLYTVKYRCHNFQSFIAIPFKATARNLYFCCDFGAPCEQSSWFL